MMLAFSCPQPLTASWVSQRRPVAALLSRSSSSQHAPPLRVPGHVTQFASAQEQQPELGVTSTVSTSPPPLPSSTLSVSVHPKETLLAILALPMAEQGDQLESIRRLLLELESMPSARPGTPLFTEFAMAGEWEPIFSTSPFSAGGNVHVRRLFQRVDSESKEITNSCHWTYRPGDDNGDDGAGVDAIIDIVSSYAFTNDSALVNITVKSHLMRVVDRVDGKKSGSLPADLQSVIEELQRSLPIEFWDPSGGLDPTTFVDPWFRISCQIGRLQGIRTVYRRKEAPSGA
jgi:hypothetical protein